MDSICDLLPSRLRYQSALEAAAPLDECSPQDSISRVRMALPARTCAITKTATGQRSFHLLALPKTLPRPLKAAKTRTGTFFGKCFSKKTG